MKNLLVFVFTFSMILMHVSGKLLIVFSIVNVSTCDTKELQQDVDLVVIFFLFWIFMKQANSQEFKNKHLDQTLIRYENWKTSRQMKLTISDWVGGKYH